MTETLVAIYAAILSATNWQSKYRLHFLARNFVTKRLEFGRGFSDPNFTMGGFNSVANVFLQPKILLQTFVSNDRLAAEYLCDRITIVSAFTILLFSCSDRELVMSNTLTK